MVAVDACTGSLNPTTLARFTSQYQNAMGEWNDGAQTIGASQADRSLDPSARGRTRAETIALGLLRHHVHGPRWHGSRCLAEACARGLRDRGFADEHIGELRS